MQKGGKRGRHTEHLGYLLAEMQFVQRAYPGDLVTHGDPPSVRRWGPTW